MIGVPDGGMGGRHSYSTSPRSSALAAVTAIEQAPSIVPRIGK